MRDAGVDVLRLIESETAKSKAQSLLEGKLKQSLTSQGTRNVGFPGGNLDIKVYANRSGELWAAFGRADGRAIPSYWNAFGVFNPEAGSQSITVEINVARESNSAQVAGFFAEDTETGEIFLMHSGKIGGGKEGIGRSAFLVWSKSTLFEVAGSNAARPGIAIANLHRDDVAERIWRFVRLVSAFKEATSNDDGLSSELAERGQRYSQEFSGLKKGSRKTKIEYLTYHGDVVEALYQERVARKSDDESVANSLLVDLYVSKGGRWTEVFEVKTSDSRQLIYTAIGQLITHGR